MSANERLPDHKRCEPTHRRGVPVNTAAAAQTLARGVRSPTPGETVARQIFEAARQVGMHRNECDLSAFRNAWYGRAGAPTFLKIYQKINECVDRSLEFHVGQAIEAMNATDPEFYAEHMEALRRVVRQSRGMGSTEGG